MGGSGGGEKYVGGGSGEPRPDPPGREREGGGPAFARLRTAIRQRRFFSAKRIGKGDYT